MGGAARTPRMVSWAGCFAASFFIFCPACEPSYEVAPADLGPSGRKVRCTSCGSVWRAAPPEADPQTIESDPDAHEAEPMLGIEDMAGSPDIKFDAMIGDEDPPRAAEEDEDDEDIE